MCQRQCASPRPVSRLTELIEFDLAAFQPLEDYCPIVMSLTGYVLDEPTSPQAPKHPTERMEDSRTLCALYARGTGIRPARYALLSMRQARLGWITHYPRRSMCGWRDQGLTSILFRVNMH